MLVFGSVGWRTVEDIFFAFALLCFALLFLGSEDVCMYGMGE